MHPPLSPIYSFLVLACVVAVSAQDYGFSTCLKKLNDTMYGNRTEGGLNNETVLDYLWDGPIQGLTGKRPNVTLGYEGCLKVCGGRTDSVSARSALEMVTTWIFPLAIIFNLPFDSLHRKKIFGTLKALINWAGSPQTALTHTIWNVRQIRHCHLMAKSRNILHKDAFFVLSCLGQFELPDDDRFYTALAYGLFRPLTQSNRQPDRDQKYTEELLSMIAFQLRMLRRRGVVPTLASLGTFIAAFVFSIVLAFHQDVGSRTGSPLTLGLLYCWLPMLVIFTIIDRNPVSADRSAALMSRWLFNVDAVLNFAQDAGADLDLMRKPEWWSRDTSEDDMSVFRIKEFIGQGRKIQYCGLAYTTIETWENHSPRLGRDLNEYTAFSQEILKSLKGPPPAQWYATAMASFSLVLLEVMMAFLIAYCTPTFGLGCWSVSLLLYGVLSSFTWTYHLFSKAPGKKGRRACTVFNFLAFAWLATLTGLVLAGGFRTCLCSTVYPFAGYMMFESFDYYLQNFDMLGPWITASAVGGSVPGLVLIVAIFWWKRCQHLWSTQETGPLQDFELGNVNSRADASWLVA